MIQDAFARLLRVDTAEIEEIRAWLIVVVSRPCLDQLRSAKTRRAADVGSLNDERLPPSLPAMADPPTR